MANMTIPGIISVLENGKWWDWLDTRPESDDDIERLCEAIDAAIPLLKSLLKKPVEVEEEGEKHGRWLIDEPEYFTCSVCGFSYCNGCGTHSEAEEKLRKHQDVYYNCPSCRAKMDLDERTPVHLKKSTKK